MDEKSGEREKIKTLAVIVVIAVVADIKMEIFMKKFICAVSIMTGVLLLPLYAQAKVDITEIDVTDEVVSEDTIYELNKQYREETIGNKAIRFLDQHGIRIFGNVREPMVIKDGYADWDCKFSEELSMSGAAFGPIRLKYRFTGEEIVLSEEKEKLEDYFERTMQMSRDIREKAEYIRKNVPENEYGGMYYDEKAGCICVYVMTDQWKDELEIQGYHCMKTENSMKDLYQELQALWEERKKYAINYIKVNECENTLDIYVVQNAESEKLQNMGYQIINAYVLHPGNCYFSVENETIEADTVMNMFDSTAFSEQLEKDENIKEHIHEGIQCLSEKYPDYDIRNLLNRIAADGNYERYLDFDKEILQFVEKLPAYVPNTEDPAEELMFGDPQRIELKSQLREYKELHPDMSYEEIYEKYLGDWEDTTEMTREAKIYQLVMKRVTGQLSKSEEVQKEEGKIKKNEINKAAIAGCIVLVIGAVAVKVWMKKEGK